ncbi:Rv1355c family protein [Mycobacterium deserti]|uniref:Rv1355c family protein n=1 Tax=Mycobacterium deserti TaxID=2978347 RepID=A0ABT2MDJ2_9MYCO|nr:Rv1355c family protein [Mycobacterium deserti]MCT7659056.1 Rv1355c family protein [Mycobacterium deserti]
MTQADEVEPFRAVLLSPGDPADDAVLDQLLGDPRIVLVDSREEQLRCLRELRPSPASSLLDEPTRWAYYPWRQSVVGILGPRAYRTVRLDRNRNLITPGEQERLGELRIGVAGLSVGHVIAHALAQQGLCGELRLADFDQLELSNLNRIPATVLEVGVNKAIVAARRIAELDPYIRLEVMTAGVTTGTLDAFLDGLDVVVEECDSMDIKVMVREAARQRRLPVLMCTSDRGLVDVERFDLEPERPILHGLLGGVTSTQLAGLAVKDKIPYMLRHLDAERVSPRLAASFVEVGQTLSSWPQLAGDVVLGAAVMAEAVRRIAVGEAIPSGQARIDIAATLSALQEPAAPSHTEINGSPVEVADEPPNPGGLVEVVAAAATRAPSGGNMQPWSIQTADNEVRISIDTGYTSLMDVGRRGSAVAVGAAVFNARVAAAAHRAVGSVDWLADEPYSQLTAVIRLGGGHDDALEQLYKPMLERTTNRRPGVRQAIGYEVDASLRAAAADEGGRLRLLTADGDLQDVAEVFAAADRVRYLTPALHREMFAELRWPGDEPADCGIDVDSLELDPADVAVLDILRRPEVMAHLEDWDAGVALGNNVREQICNASAIGVITVQGSALLDFARGGAAVEVVWIAAQQRGFAVQPISPAFLHAISDDELSGMSARFAPELRSLRRRFRQLCAIEPDESLVLVLKLSHAGPPSVRSRRRRLHGARSTPG